MRAVMYRWAPAALMFAACSNAPAAVEPAPLPDTVEHATPVEEATPIEIPALRDDHRLMSVAGILSKPSAVILESDGDFVAIYIDSVQRTAIAYRRGEETRHGGRPRTHDLIDSVLDAVGAQLVRVEINEETETAFVASLVVTTPDEVRRIDARPSDAIVLAASEPASPIYMVDELIRKEGVRLDEPFETGLTECDEYFRRALPCTEQGLTDMDRVVQRDRARDSFNKAPQASLADRENLAIMCQQRQAKLARRYGDQPCWSDAD